jgi:hypothetical protein
VRQLVDGSVLAGIVLGYRHTAFRLETRERYNEPEEAEPLARFLAGEPDYGWNEDWAVMIRKHAASGRRMQRVRIVSEPHSDYTRFGLDLARVNVAAGEDIRYLPRGQVAGLDLPDHDFWLIDSTRLAVLRFGDDDVLLGAEVVDDPAAVVTHSYYRDVAWHYAVPYPDYVG